VPDRPAVSAQASLDLSVPTDVHIVGIGGAGMSAIASVLSSMGHRVSGSDLKVSRPVERLRAQGVRVEIGHAAANLGAAAVLAVSTAIRPDNPEVVAAHEASVPVLRRSEVMAALTAVKATVSVAGTHGKTTTSSMLAVILADAALDPSFIIGGDVHQIGSGAVWADGEWFVVEADESDGTFLALDTQLAVVTNVEPDHLSHYGSEEELVAAFGEFVTRARGGVVACADDPLVAELVAERVAAGDVETYGESVTADVRLLDLEAGRDGTSFAVERGGTRLGRVELPVPGRHNALNAVGALTTALRLGASFESAADALSHFGGVARRFERRGTAAGVTFIDDYAHLPSEIEAALEAARDGAWGRVICVFQPHRYSRIGALWQDYGTSFVDADLVAVTQIYSAGEDPVPGVTGRLIVDAVAADDPDRDVSWQPDRAALVDWLGATLQDGDLCLTLGAGDLTTLPDDVIRMLEAAPGTPPEQVG
jgi:UDP-N-acetylmuramate--alanine ligase